MHGIKKRVKSVTSQTNSQLLCFDSALDRDYIFSSLNKIKNSFKEFTSQEDLEPDDVALKEEKIPLHEFLLQSRKF